MLGIQLSTTTSCYNLSMLGVDLQNSLLQSCRQDLSIRMANVVCYYHLSYDAS